jgi:NADPH2:quinone reductase
MRALILPSLSIETRPDPVARDGEIVVRVYAAGINRADLLQRIGKYPPPVGWPEDIPGLEYAGEVVAIGRGVTYWELGDRVMGLVGGGAQAEYVVVHQAEALAIPDGMSYRDAAAVPEVFLTAWDAMVRQGQVRAGERVLVHAIGSGVGTAALQLGRVLGLTVIGTSRTPDKLARATALGLDHAVLASDDNWAAAVGDPVQVIIDTLGADYFEANISLLAPGGRLVILGTLSGRVAGQIDLGRVLRQRLTIRGITMRSRPPGERRELVQRFNGEILPHFGNGTIRPIVDTVVPMSEAVRGYELLASNETFGKVVIEM